jgi:integrase
MARRHLTAAGVNRIRPPPAGQVEHFDAGYPGLALRISYGGSRSWVYFYRWQGKQKRLMLGPWPAVELAQAREAWREAHNRLAKGLEPIAKPDIAADDSIASVVEDWLKRDQAENRSREGERYVRREAIPAWGALRIGDITRRQVLDLIDRIADRGTPVAARRCHAALHRLFRWSVGRGIIEMNPMADLPKIGMEVKRTRVLSNEELAHAWHAAQHVGWPMGSTVQLLILTAARRDEIGELQWREIDKDCNEIRLEGDRTKNGEPHTIPLSPAARALIDALPRVGSKFVYHYRQYIRFRLVARREPRQVHARSRPEGCEGARRGPG